MTRILLLASTTTTTELYFYKIGDRVGSIAVVLLIIDCIERRK